MRHIISTSKANLSSQNSTGRFICDLSSRWHILHDLSESGSRAWSTHRFALCVRQRYRLCTPHSGVLRDRPRSSQGEICTHSRSPLISRPFGGTNIFGPFSQKWKTEVKCEKIEVKIGNMRVSQSEQTTRPFKSHQQSFLVFPGLQFTDGGRCQWCEDHWGNYCRPPPLHHIRWHGLGGKGMFHFSCFC